jgi:hypothetical protein
MSSQFLHVAYLFLSFARALSYDPDYKFACLPLHGLRRLVRGRQDHQPRYMVGHGISVCRHWHVRCVEDMSWPRIGLLVVLCTDISAHIEDTVAWGEEDDQVRDMTEAASALRVVTLTVTSF